MTPAQFEAVATLAQLRAGPQCEAARLVLVDGLRAADAARTAGCSASGLSNTMAVCRRVLGLARQACDCEQIAQKLG